MRIWIVAVATVVSMMGPGSAHAEKVTRAVLNFSDLEGWAADTHTEALSTFLVTCNRIRSDGWSGLCEKAAATTDAKTFFERNFLPVVFEDGAQPLFTGYFEPELAGSRVRKGEFRYPLYTRPPEAPKGEPWLTRAEIEGGRLAGRGLEIAWLSDPVDAFFLHVQGSGRLRLPDGSSMRVGFGGKNGHKYRSVGREMARRGLLPENKVSAGAIRNWIRRNPEEGRKVLWHNQSFVFFREIRDLPPDAGPIGAMSRPVTAMRTIAVDPDIVPLGAPVWVEKAGRRPLRRLMIAQDTGSAIKGAQRADIFYGSGPAAGKLAGRIRDTGRMVVLMPRKVALGG